MTPISEANFIVTDVETNGNDPVKDRIIEIGCIVIRDFEIIDSFSSLVNPHKPIPWFIKKVTHITTEMVSNAPDSDYVFHKVYEILSQKNSFFVAHNSSFDWHFVNESIKREDIDFTPIPQICTYKLARKILPSDIKKNVGSLATFFNIPIQNRHRAYDDANATAHFFIEMLIILRERYNIVYVEELLEFQNAKANRAKKPNSAIVAKLLKYKQIAPASMGLLIFIGKNGNILYISASRDIKNQINFLIELYNDSIKKIRDILKEAVRIDWIETKNELETNILNHRKITQLMPKYNYSAPIDLYSADDEALSENFKKQLAANKNMIVLFPNSEQEKTVDMYFIKNGFYVNSFTIGCKANLDEIYENIKQVFFTNELESVTDIGELKIIHNWLNKFQPIMQKIQFPNQNEVDFCIDVENKIRNFYNPEGDKRDWKYLQVDY